MHPCSFNQRLHSSKYGLGSYRGRRSRVLSVATGFSDLEVWTVTHSLQAPTKICVPDPLMTGHKDSAPLGIILPGPTTTPQDTSHVTSPLPSYSTPYIQLIATRIPGPHPIRCSPSSAVTWHSKSSNLQLLLPTTNHPVPPGLFLVSSLHCACSHVELIHEMPQKRHQILSPSSRVSPTPLPFDARQFPL